MDLSTKFYIFYLKNIKFSLCEAKGRWGLGGIPELRKP